MPSKWETFPIEFRGGLISNMSPLQQGVNAVGSAIFLQNFEPSKEGGYKKVLGYTPYINAVVPGEAGSSILGAVVVNSNQVIAVKENVSNVSQYYINSGSSWSSLGAAASLGGRVYNQNFNFDGNHKIIMVDGVNYPAIFNDTTDTLSFLSSVSDIQGATHVEVFKNHIFVSKGSELYFSVPYEETNWSVADGAGVINVGHTITGLKYFRDQLIVFSQNAIQRVVGSSFADFQLIPIASSIGCIAPASIQEVGGDILFLAADGLRFLGATDRIGDFSLSIASSPIEKNTLDFIRNSSDFCSIVIRKKAQYRIFGYIPSEDNATSKGLLATKFDDQSSQGMQWAELKGIKAFAADSRYVGGEEVIVFGASDGYLYKMEFGDSFNGNDIEAIYQSPFIPINDPQVRKTLYKMSMYVDIEGTFSVDVDFSFDFYKPDNYNAAVQPNTITLSSESNGVFIWGASNTVYTAKPGTASSFVYGSELDKLYNSPVIGSGKTFSFRVEDNSTNPSFSLDTVVFEYATNDRI